MKIFYEFVLKEMSIFIPEKYAIRLDDVTSSPKNSRPRPKELRNQELNEQIIIQTPAQFDSETRFLVSSLTRP